VSSLWCFAPELNFYSLINSSDNVSMKQTLFSTLSPLTLLNANSDSDEMLGKTMLKMFFFANLKPIFFSFEY